MASGFGQRISGNYYAVTSLTAMKLSGYVSQSVDRTNRRVTISLSVRPAFYRISSNWNLTAGASICSDSRSSNYIHVKIGDAASTSGNGEASLTAATTFTATGGNNYTNYDGYVNNGGNVAVQSVSKTYSYDDNGSPISASYEMKGRLGGVDFDLSGSVTTDSIDPAYKAPNKPTVSGLGVDARTNKITFGTSSFGYPASGNVYLYGGTSNNPTTQIASKTTTGNSTFTHSGLRPNTTYYYRARAKNSNNSWSDYSDVITVKTPPAILVPYPNNPAQSNTTKNVKKIEVPLNGLAKNATKLYRSVGGVAQRIY